MDKKEARKLGAWISLLGGTTFVLGALTAIYVAFIMRPETAMKVLTWLARTLHRR